MNLFQVLRSEIRRKLKRPITKKQNVSSLNSVSNPKEIIQQPSTKKYSHKVPRNDWDDLHLDVLPDKVLSPEEVTGIDFNEELIVEIEIESDIASECDSQCSEFHTTSKIKSPSAKRIRKQIASPIVDSSDCENIQSDFYNTCITKPPSAKTTHRLKTSTCDNVTDVQTDPLEFAKPSSHTAQLRKSKRKRKKSRLLISSEEYKAVSKNRSCSYVNKDNVEQTSYDLSNRHETVIVEPLNINGIKASTSDSNVGDCSTVVMQQGNEFKTSKRSPLKLSEASPRNSARISFRKSSKTSSHKSKSSDVTRENDDRVNQGVVLESKTPIINSTSSKTDFVKNSKNLTILIEELEGNSKTNNKLRTEPICLVCEKTAGEMISCNGECFRFFHAECITSSNGANPSSVVVNKDSFYCYECQQDCHKCFVCKQSNEHMIKCTRDLCGKFYHEKCVVDLTAQASVSEYRGDTIFGNDEKEFVCPQHYCSRCLGMKASEISVTKKRLDPIQNTLVKCIRCPTTYHKGSCLVAGCTILTSQHMICSQHYSKNRKTHANVTWCFVCSTGGSLVCCDTCPASFHPECTDTLTGVPEGVWKCEDCVRHNKLKYGEIVWAKFGHYR